MNGTLGILFHLRRDKKRKDGTIPIYLRITIDGKRSEFAINRLIEEDKWDVKSGYAIGTKESARSLNTYIDVLRNRIYEAQRELLQDKKPVTSETVKNRILGKDKQSRTLLEVFQYHNKIIEEQVGKGYAALTKKRYETAMMHVSSFLQHAYQKQDIDLQSLNHEFVTRFEHYLKTVRNCNSNTTAKYIKNLKKVVNLARKNEWLQKDPFINYKIQIKEVKREFLSQEELRKMEELEITDQSLEMVRDIFVFSCYTGLAYTDIIKLTEDNIVPGEDGSQWIFTEREKTETKVHIPLLPKPLEIIGKYKDHPIASNKGVLLPTFSNQKMNLHLKPIAQLAGIRKNVTFHMARHTFATTVTLTNDVPIESVSEMLGHRSIRTTQIYAKVLDKKVGRDMNQLREKLGKRDDNSQPL